MATTYTVTLGAACKPTAPVLFDTAQSINPTGMIATGMGQEAGKVDGNTINCTAIGGAPVVLRVETDGNPNTP